MPVAVAVLLAALLAPAVAALQRHGVPRGAATVLVMVGGLAMLGGVLTFVAVTQLAAVQAWPTLRIFRLDGALHDKVDVVL